MKLHRGKMNKILKVLAIVATVGVLGANSAAAQPPGGHGPEGPRGGRMLRLPLEELDLTSEQEGAVEQEMRSYRSQLQSAFAVLRTAHETLDALVTAGSSDESAISAAAAEVGTAMGSLSLIQAKMVAAIRACLSSEQIEELDTLLAEHKRRGPPF